jgi:hypothetical protein
MVSRELSVSAAAVWRKFVIDAPDFKRAYLLAQLSAIVYETDLNTLSLDVARLGLNFVGVVETPGFQSLVVQEQSGGYIVDFRGTPVTCGRDIEDAVDALAIDAGIKHTSIPGGGKVLTGVYRAVQKNWPDILRLIDLSKPLTITGHSLGATEGLVAGAFVPRTTDLTVIVCAPFQAADTAFWRAVYGGRRQPLLIGRLQDFAPGFDHADPVTRHPGPICHLLADGWQWTAHWPFVAESIGDHAVEGYVEDLRKLAEQPVLA